MATWTQTDVDKLRAAIVALASGELVQQVRYDGPPARSITYHPAELSTMRDLLAAMQADVARSAVKSRTRYAVAKKGV
jgi:hypothetical protein